MKQRKICRGCLKEKPFSQFKTDNRLRSGIASQCKVCLTKKSKQWRLRNLKRSLEKAKEYKKKNKVKIRKITRRYVNKNRAKITSFNAKRRAAKLQRTPKWLTKEDLACIQRIYRKAQAATKRMGVLYHVDHIYPLQGRKVSGLHVPGNLQILTAEENVRKNNRYTP